MVLTGCGLATPLGLGAWATLQALLAGRTLASRNAQLPEDVAPVDLVRAVGSVKSVQHGADDPAIELAERVAREAATAGGVDCRDLPVFLGTSKGAIGPVIGSLRDPDPDWQAAWLRSPGRATALQVGPHAWLAHRLARRTGLQVRGHVVAACASGLVALEQARAWLAWGASADGAGPRRALVVSTEASLHPMQIHSYQRLGVLAPLTPAGYRQQPWAIGRSGFMLGEQAAAVLLEALPSGGVPAPGQVELVATACGAEGGELIRPTKGMPLLRRLAGRLAASLPRVSEPLYLHPHAPGTVEHDPQELAALARGLGPAAGGVAGMYACKGAIGHGLGAAGLSALVLAALLARVGRRPAMPWLADARRDTQLPWALFPEAQVSAEEQRWSRQAWHVVFAAGFGGHTAGALLRAW